MKLFTKYTNLCDHDSSTSWTDRRMTYDIAMPCSAQHCMVKMTLTTAKHLPTIQHTTLNSWIKL